MNIFLEKEYEISFDWGRRLDWFKSFFRLYGDVSGCDESDETSHDSETSGEDVKGVFVENVLKRKETIEISKILNSSIFNS